MTAHDSRHSHVFHRSHKRAKPVISHGEGIWLFDTEGRRYLDASGGAVVVNVGHGIADIASAIHAQAARTAHVHPTMFTSQAVEDLARRLAEYLPLPDARLFFLASGAEAVEAAIKFARQVQIARGHPGRYKVIGRWGSYHGASLGALAVMGKPSMRSTYEPMFVDMPHIDPPYCYRCPFGLTYPACGVRCAHALEDEIKRQGPESVSAFIAEPISGATLGAVIPPAEYWPIVRDICDRYGILLIADEVMTGMGRTGRWFAVQEWDVIPDMVTLGKGVSGGYLPLSALAAPGDLVDQVNERLGDFNHGGTFSHHAVSAAAGLATLDTIEARDLVEHSARLGRLLGEKLHAALDGHPHVGDIRGRGLMWGIELVASRADKQPFPPGRKIAAKLADHAFAQGMIVYAMSGCVDGWAGDHVMVAPPLIVTEDEIDEIVRRLKASVDAVTLGAAG
jgi:hypothetical protein